MANDELTKELYQAESAIRAVDPYLKAWEEIDNDRIHLELKKEKDTSKLQYDVGMRTVSSIVVAVLIVLWLLLPLFRIFFVFMIPVFGIWAAFAHFTVKQTKETLEEDERQLAAIPQRVMKARAELELKKSEVSQGLHIYNSKMPKECVVPENARLFISYFETGRADSLKEAYALFEEHLHRQKMEDLAQQQVQAARHIERAAALAAERAGRAADAAGDAANAARNITNAVR